MPTAFVNEFLTEDFAEEIQQVVSQRGIPPLMLFEWAWHPMLGREASDDSKWWNYAWHWCHIKGKDVWSPVDNNGKQILLADWPDGYGELCLC